MCKIQQQGLSVINQAELLKLEMKKHKIFLTKVENVKTYSALEKGVKRRIDISDRIDLEYCSEGEKLDEAKSLIFEEFFYTVNQLDNLTSEINQLLNICIDQNNIIANKIEGRVVDISDGLYSCRTYENFIKNIDMIIKNTKSILDI